MSTPIRMEAADRHRNDMWRLTAPFGSWQRRWSLRIQQPSHRISCHPVGSSPARPGPSAADGSSAHSDVRAAGVVWPDGSAGAPAVVSGGFRRRGQDRPGGCGRHRHGQEPDFLFLPSLPTPSASRRSLRPEINRCGTHRPQVLLITSNTPDGGNTRESLVGRLSARRKACLHACVLATDLHPRDAGGFWIGTASSGQEPLAGKPDGRFFICVGMTQRLGVRSPKPAECVFDSRHPCEAPPIGERA